MDDEALGVNLFSTTLDFVHFRAAPSEEATDKKCISHGRSKRATRMKSMPVTRSALENPLLRTAIAFQVSNVRFSREALFG